MSCLGADQAFESSCVLCDLVEACFVGAHWQLSLFVCTVFAWVRAQHIEIRIGARIIGSDAAYNKTLHFVRLHGDSHVRHHTYSSGFTACFVLFSDRLTQGCPFYIVATTF